MIVDEMMLFCRIDGALLVQSSPTKPFAFLVCSPVVSGSLKPNGRCCTAAGPGQGKVNFVILCMGAVATIDYSALEILRGILLEWRRKGLHCLVADANSTVLELLREQLGHELLQQFQTKPAGQTAEVHFEIQEVLSIEDAVIVASQKLKCLQADSKRMADPV